MACNVKPGMVLATNWTHFWDPKGFLLSRTFEHLVGHVHRWRNNGHCDESQPLTKFLPCQKIWVAVLQCDSSYCSWERALVLDKKCHVTHRAPITGFFIKLHNICLKLLLINIMTQAFFSSMFDLLRCLELDKCRIQNEVCIQNTEYRMNEEYTRAESELKYGTFSHIL